MHQPADRAATFGKCAYTVPRQAASSLPTGSKIVTAICPRLLWPNQKLLVTKIYVQLAGMLAEFFDVLALHAFPLKPLPPLNMNAILGAFSYTDSLFFPKHGD